MGRRIDYSQSVVWITGASYGIGRAVALELADRGSRVALSARSQGKLSELADEIGRDQALPVPLDVTDKQANHEAVDQIIEQFGQLDIALLNAGTNEYVDLDDPEDFDADIFDKLTSINYLGMMYGVEACLPHLAESDDPLLVGMSSTAAFVPLPRASAYGASKVAIRHAFESLRLSFEQFDIATTIVCPGFVETPLTDKNDFPMPFIISADNAAERIADGMERKQAELHFPKRFSYLVKLLSLLPGPIYRWLMNFFPREKD